MSYADRNDVEVSIRKGHDGRTVWEIFLREIRGRMDQDAYIEFRCEQLMDMIRSARMKEEYVDIETKRKGLQRFLNQIADLSAIACQGY